MANIDSRKLTRNITDKYQVENNTLVREVKENPKDRIEVEVGDSKQPDFKPQVKIKRWDNEVNFSMRAVEHPDAEVEFDGEVVKYKTPDYEVHQYDKPEAGEDGGFEFEWLLPEKPTSNVLEATIQSKELNFFYQPALTEKEIEEGAERPENVAGSYAVYHKSKGGLNRAGGMDYKTGKAFHIYRPKAIDAEGEEVWCELEIDDELGVLKVTVSQEFLDKAVYPVVVDPTFGYDTVGSSSQFIWRTSFGSYSDQNIVGGYFNLGEVGKVTQLSASVARWDATDRYTFGIYKESDDSLVATSNEGGVPAGSGFVLNLEIDPAETLTADDYWLVVWGEKTGTLGHAESGSLRYDSTGDGGIQANSNYPTFPDPLDPTSQDRKYSIYAIYVGDKLETLQEDFETDPIDTDKWNVSPSGAWVIDTGRAKAVVSTSGNQEADIRSQNKFDSLNSHIFFEYEHDTTQNGYDAYIHLEMNPTSFSTRTHGLLISIQDTNLEFFVFEDENEVKLGSTETYNPTNHRWFRIRHETDTYYIDTSPDGINWTNQRSRSDSAILHKEYAFLNVQVANENSGDKTSYLDNVNISQETDDNSDRDAKITGQATVNSERDTRIVGNDTTNSERDAVITGNDIDNSEREARLVGSDTSNAERDAKIIGQDSSNSERGAITRGSDATNSERGAKVTGQDSDDSERSAKITGTSDSVSERGAKLTGQATDNSERGATLDGVASDNSERSAKLTGSETSNAERGSRMIGGYLSPQYVVWSKINTGSNNVTGVILHERDVVKPGDSSITYEASPNGGNNWESITPETYHEFTATGSDLRIRATLNATSDLLQTPTINELSFVWTEAGAQTVNDERSATIHGIDDTDSERGAITRGSLSDNDERGAKVSGTDDADSERGGKVTGQATANSERSAKLTGQATSDSERGSKVTGESQANSERPAKVTGNDTANSERGAKVSGTDTTNSERSAKLTGGTVVNSERGAKIAGTGNVDNSERAAKIHGVDTIGSDRSAVVTGQDSDNDERGAKVTGSVSDNDERSAKLTGSDDEADERGAKTTGQAASNSERGAITRGSDTSNSERGAVTRGSEDSNSERGAKITGLGIVETSDRAAKVSGLDTAQSTRQAKIRGSEDTDSERGAKITGSISSERGAKVTGVLPPITSRQLWKPVEPDGMTWNSPDPSDIEYKGGS